MTSIRPASPSADPNRGPALITISAILLFVAVISSILRLWVRLSSHALRWDDLIIVIAVLLSVIHTAFSVLKVHSGYGRHQSYLTVEQTREALKWDYITQHFLFLILCFTKISICLFALRIKNTKWLRRSLYALMIGLVVTNGGCVIVLLAKCHPIRGNWDGEVGKCWNPNIYNDIIWVQVGYSIFSDLICSLLPIVVLWNLKIPFRFKMAIRGLMGLGLLATACGAARASLSAGDLVDDLTWSLAIISIWATLEIGLGIIAANLALSRVYYRFLRGGIQQMASHIQSPVHTFFSQRNTPKDVHDTQLASLASTRSENAQIPRENTSSTKTTEIDVSQEHRGSTDVERQIVEDKV